MPPLEHTSIGSIENDSIDTGALVSILNSEVWPLMFKVFSEPSCFHETGRRFVEKLRKTPPTQDPVGLDVTPPDHNLDPFGSQYSLSPRVLSFLDSFLSAVS